MAKKKQNQQVNSINIQKLNGLHKSFSFLPKNAFSKIIVVFCLISIIGIIIASYVLLVLGYDTSSLITPSLCALSGELLILGAKRILAKSEAIQDTVLDEIKENLRDGKLYDSSGNVVGYEEQLQNFLQKESKLEETLEDTIQEVQDTLEFAEQQNQESLTNDSIISNTSVPTVSSANTTPPKKRGRPKKVETTSIETEEVKTEIIKSESETVSDWYNEDMSG